MTSNQQALPESHWQLFSYDQLVQQCMILTNALNAANLDSDSGSARMLLERALAEFEPMTAKNVRLYRDIKAFLAGLPVETTTPTEELAYKVGVVLQQNDWTLSLDAIAAVIEALSVVQGSPEEPSGRAAIEGDLVPDHWWRVHRELANGHTTAALAVVAAVLEGRPLPECVACNVTTLTINAEKAADSPAPCHIHEYDGAFKCLTHQRTWGAVGNPQEPCSGWSAEKAIPVTWTCPSCAMRGRSADAYVCTNCGEKRPENGE